MLPAKTAESRQGVGQVLPHMLKPMITKPVILAALLACAAPAAQAAPAEPAARAAGTDRGSGQVLQKPVPVAVDASAPGKPLRHVWQHFGYDECNFTVAPAAAELMRTLAEVEPEPVYLRQHFLLATGDGVPSLKWGSTNAYTEDERGEPVYDWRILDGIFDAVVGVGCRPLVEIGFMPQALSARPEPYRPASPFQLKGYGVFFPPRDYEKWGVLIREWALHVRERYPGAAATWLWELWNEPNIPYWQGSFEEYCRLFDHTEKALHEALPGAVLGGPHTAGTRDSFLRRFLEHCLRGTNAVTGKTGTRLDYVGFHSKGATRLVDGHPQMDLGVNLANTRHDFATIASFPELRGKPVIIGECDPEGAAALSSRVQSANGYRNGSAYAAYEAALMVHTMGLAEREGVDLRGVLTWAFLFDGREYFEGFRTLSTNGIGKPVLNAFVILGMLQGRRVPLTSGGALGIERIIEKGVRAQPDVDGLATTTGELTQVLVWNYHDDVAPAEPVTVSLSIVAPRGQVTRARVTHHRIDDDHSNSYTRWLAMGSPQSPSSQEIAALREAAQLTLLEPIRYVELREGRLSLGFSLPRHAVSLVEVRWWP